MKEVKFTVENRDRHFCYNPDRIVTTRDKPLGKVGDKFIIYDPLRVARVFVLKDIISASFLSVISTLYACNLWVLEGFANPSDFFQEICRIYPRASQLYIHEFVSVSEVGE